MKKIVVAIFIAILIAISTNFHKKDELSIFVSNEGICEFYCEKVLKNSSFISSILSSGDGFFVSTNLKSSKKVYDDLLNVKSFKIILNKDFEISKLKMQYIKTEMVEDMKISYGFSNFFNNCVCIDGKKANIQIVERQDKIIIGVPIIMGSY